MTNISLAIQKAVEGGWVCKACLEPEKNYQWYLSDILLDPTFWQALGRTEGWGILHCENCGKKAVPVRKKESDPEYWADCCGRKRKLEYGVSSEVYQHRLIDAIQQGRSIDEFFGEILKK